MCLCVYVAQYSGALCVRCIFNTIAFCLLINCVRTSIMIRATRSY